MSAVNVPLAFNKMTNSMAGANPNTGEGSLGEWPPNGDHVCLIQSMTFNERARYYFQPKGQKAEQKPSIGIQFHYRLLSDPNSPEPLEWKGKPMIFPLAEYPADGEWEDGWGAARMDRDRFAGFFSVIMGRTWDAKNFGSEVAALAQKVGEGNVAATILAQHRKYKKKTDKEGEETGKDNKDFCKELAQSSPSTPS